MDGTPLYGLDEAKLFRPASTAKLFTTAAAMSILGPESTVVTGVYGDLDSASGVVTGDLVLLGQGDPSFGTDDLPYHPGAADANSSSLSATRAIQELTTQLVARGVHSVTGKVLGDDTLFNVGDPPEGWAAEDLVWGYGALPDALSIADNQLTLTITPRSLPTEPPAGSSMSAQVHVDEAVPYLQISAQPNTAPADRPQPDRLDLYRPDPHRPAPYGDPSNPGALMVSGSVTSGHPALREHVALGDPALYAAQILQAQLTANGIATHGAAYAYPGVRPWPEPFLSTLRSPNPKGESVLGKPAAWASACGSTPHPATVLAAHTSPPLRDEIAFTLKTSANLHAEVLLQRLGLKIDCHGFTLDGARMVRTWLLNVGIPEGDFTFYDGSGLSTKDLVTPRAEAQLLAYAAKQAWFPQWKAALPIGGVDGTLRTRFTEAPLKDHIFAKTGTLGESRALAGYVRCQSGREVIFAILDDDHQPGSSADRAVMDQIVEAIATNN